MAGEDRWYKDLPLEQRVARQRETAMRTLTTLSSANVSKRSSRYVTKAWQDSPSDSRRYPILANLSRYMSIWWCCHFYTYSSRWRYRGDSIKTCRPVISLSTEAVYPLDSFWIRPRVAGNYAKVTHTIRGRGGWENAPKGWVSRVIPSNCSHTIYVLLTTFAAESRMIATSSWQA